jgi:hypothetical protein
MTPEMPGEIKCTFISRGEEITDDAIFKIIELLLSDKIVHRVPSDAGPKTVS